jgi:hypothetical protein
MTKKDLFVLFLTEAEKIRIASDLVDQANQVLDHDDKLSVRPANLMYVTERLFSEVMGVDLAEWGYWWLYDVECSENRWVEDRNGVRYYLQTPERLWDFVQVWDIEGETVTQPFPPE